jgi:hypothetical protein
MFSMIFARGERKQRKNEPENNNWTNEVVHNAAEQEAQHKKIFGRKICDNNIYKNHYN